MSRRGIGWFLLLITALLCMSGFGLYLTDHVGWAQFCWVFASGTAGGSVMAMFDAQ